MESIKTKSSILEYSVNNSSRFKGSVVLTSRDWDPQFHGSVHTATVAVCIVLVIFVVILGTFGNGLVLISSLQCRKRRSNFDIFIYNLAAVDFIICSCLSPIFLYLLFANPPSPRGFCGGYLFICTICGLQSLLTLVAIATYRQSRIRGMRSTLTATKTTLILLSTYTVCFASALGGTLQASIAWDSSNVDCQAIINSGSPTSNNVVLYFISPIVIISFLLITASYFVIARAVKVQSELRTRALQSILNQPSKYKPIPTLTYRDNNPSKDLHQIAPETVAPKISSSKSRQKPPNLKCCSCCSCAAALDKETKAVSMCYVVILIIALCWTPLIVSHFVELFVGESIIIYQVKLCGIALVFLNSALNPYMYAQNNTRIKRRYARVFWDMLRCECRAPPKTKFRTSSPGLLIPKTKTKPNMGIYTEEGFVPFLQPKSTVKFGQYPRLEMENTNLNFTCNSNTTNIVQSNRKLRCYSNISTKVGSHNLLLSSHNVQIVPNFENSP